MHMWVGFSPHVAERRTHMFCFCSISIPRRAAAHRQTSDFSKASRRSTPISVDSNRLMRSDSVCCRPLRHCGLRGRCNTRRADTNNPLLPVRQERQGVLRHVAVPDSGNHNAFCTSPTAASISFPSMFSWAMIMSTRGRLVTPSRENSDSTVFCLQARDRIRRHRRRLCRSAAQRREKCLHAVCWLL